MPTEGVAVGAQGCVVTATVAAGKGYKVDTAAGAAATATLTMRTEVAVTPDSTSVTEGEPVSFTLIALPPPPADLTVNVSLSQSGSFLAASGARTVTIPASARSSTLSAATVDDLSDESHGSVTATVKAGSGYARGAPRAASVRVYDNDPTSPAPGGPAPPIGPTPPLPRPKSVPEATITASKTPVTEGEQVSFSLTLFPTFGSPRTVNLKWEDPGGFLSGTPPSTATATSAAPVPIVVPTVNDAASEADASVTVTVAAGIGYVAGATASIVVKDNDSRAVSISVPDSREDPYGDGSAIYATVSEGDIISFTLTATPAPESALPVRLVWTVEEARAPTNAPETVTIPITGSVSTSVTAYDDDKDNYFDSFSLGIHIQVGDRNHRGAPHVVYITVNDDDD